MVRKGFITFIGFMVLLAGLLMTVLPGPGLLTMVAGLAILSTRHDWAKQWLEKLKGHRPKKSKPLGPEQLDSPPDKYHT